jgi:predicted membrane channel-forming protein YqfA (hemolysin III family)
MNLKETENLKEKRKRKRNKMKLNEETRNRIFFVLILLIIILAAYMIFYVRSESYKAMNNPLAYGIQNVEKGSQSTVQCNCISYDSKNNRVFFQITNKGIEGGIVGGNSLNISNVSISQLTQ